MKTEINTAELKDLPELIQLLTTLFSQELEFIPDEEKQRRGLKMIIENPSLGEILIIRNKNGIFGMVSLLFSISTALGGKVATLEDMVIALEYRHRGFGSMLLKKALSTAKERGCLRITLLTDFNNEGAIKYYQNHGFTKSPMIPLRQLL